MSSPNHFRQATKLLASLAVALAIIVSLGACSAEAPKAEAPKAEAPKDLTIEEAGSVLGNLVPNVKVLEVRRSEIDGIWEVVLIRRGKKRIAYIDDARKHLIDGRIVNITDKADLTNKRYQEINKIDFASIPLDDALVMGPVAAAHKVVVFDDPD